MPNIPGIPESLAPAPGVEMNAPPAEYIDKAERIISDAVAKLGPNEKGALTWLAMMKGDKIIVNLAVVAKVNDHFSTVAWIGRTWGEPIEAGIAGRLVW